MYSRIPLIIYFILSCISLFADTIVNSNDTIRVHKAHRFSPVQSDSLVIQIEHLHTVLNTITNTANYDFGTKHVEEGLPEIQEYLNVISHALSMDSNVLNVKDLQMFEDLLGDMQKTLSDWRAELFKSNRELIKMNAEMNSFIQDSFAQKIAADSLFSKLYLEQLSGLAVKWRNARHVTQQNLIKITTLQAALSNSYFKAVDLRYNVHSLILRSGVGTLAKEYDYLWLMRTNTSSPLQVFERTKNTYLGEQKILGYFLKINYINWIWLFIIAALFFLWVYRNFRKVKAVGLEGSKVNDEDKDPFTIRYLKPIPILSTLVFMLSIAPLFDDTPPSAYVEFTEFMLMLSLTVIFWKTWSRNIFIYWLAVVFLFIFASTLNSIPVPGLVTRLSLLTFTMVSFLFGIRFLKKYHTDLPLGLAIKVVTIIYIIFNGLAIVANIFGRYSLSKLLTSAAVMSLAQMIGMTVLVQIIIEAIYLQIVASRISKGKPLTFDHKKLFKSFNRLLVILVIIFWLFIFASNLSIYQSIAAFTGNILNATHKIGSTTYTYGNLVIFAFVIYIASVLQKYIGYFFGEAKEDFEKDLNKKGSRTVLFRLVIIVLGFLIAIVASGLPIDKVTVVLGALGVGVGLGLQSLVNNLVSGVIIIFEKPMQVGDYVEVGDKKGRVQDIGIRASKIVTSDGSQIIVPNGDILSSHMVNWTQNDNSRRTEIKLKIEPATEVENAKKEILEVLKQNKLVIQERQVDILLDDVTEKTVEITVRVWINDLYREHEFKSEAISSIHQHFAEHGISIIGS